MDMPRYLAVEFGLEAVASILAAFLVAAAGVAGFFNRVAFVGGIGLIAAIATNGSYWNWWGFPTDYTLAYGFIQLVGYLAAGVPIALLVKRS
jgi:hypothetical protein